MATTEKRKRTGTVRSAAWTKHRRAMLPALRARADGTCERCGAPFDPNAPARSRLAESVDHVYPVGQGGVLLAPLEDLRLVHVGCNSSRGNRTRRMPPIARVTRPTIELVELDAPRHVNYARVAKRKDKRERDAELRETMPGLFDADFLNSTATRRPSSSNLSPKTAGQSDVEKPRRISPEAVELVPPRLETGRPSRVAGSYGAEAAAWIRQYLGDELRPWQRYALERILEHDDAGALVWRRIILSVSRQSGKSVLARGLCGWRLGAADVFGEPQTILHVANLRSTAANIWKPAARALEETAGAAIRRANGQEAIELADGSAWKLAASTLDAGVGDSNSLAFCDEAWRLSRDVVDGSIVPTTIERESSQVVLVSTAGDGGSSLLLEDRAAAIEEMGDPDAARILLLEWSAAPEREDGDREGWREASPHYSKRRRDALEQAFALSQQITGDPIEDAKRRLVWTRQYLNRWVESASSWMGAGQWDAGARTSLELPPAGGTVAIEHHVSGYPFGAVLAVADDAGDVAIAARVFDRRADLWAWLTEVGRDRRGLTLLHPPGYKGHVPGAIRAQLVQVGQAEQYSGYGPTVAAALEGRILHDGDAELRKHVLSAGTVRIPDRGTALSSKHSAGPIFLARAMVWAVAHELRPDAGRRAMVVSGVAQR